MVIEDELSGLNRELSMFPQRAFDFLNAGSVVIDQDVADVGSLVWDAEVMLAHYLDRAFGPKLRGLRVVELGAGTGLAGIVAARLGASVLLTDQAKLLPTLMKNGRANAPELEEQHLRPPSPIDVRPFRRTNPPSQHAQGDSESANPGDVTMQSLETDVGNPRKVISPRFSENPTAALMAKEATISSERRGKNNDGAATDTSCAASGGIFTTITKSEDVPKEDWACCRQDSGENHHRLKRRQDGDADRVTKALPPADMDGDGDHGCGDDRDDSHRGSWRVAELLFAEDENNLQPFFEAETRLLMSRENPIAAATAAAGTRERVGGGSGQGRRQGGLEGCNTREGEGGEDLGHNATRHRGGHDDALFDLVIAADVVYLTKLWDAMSFTIKALLKPEGEALMTFEQRRGNVEGFFASGALSTGDEFSIMTSVETDPCCGEKSWEEVDFRDSITVEGLGDAARIAHVRFFRLKEKDLS